MAIRRYALPAALLVVCTVIVSGCGGSSDGSTALNNGSGVTPQFDTNAIAGFWDSSNPTTDDVAFTEISTDGRITVFDYLGDSYDGGADCYVTYVGSIRPFVNNVYEITYGDPGAAGTADLVYVTAFVVNGQLSWQSDSAEPASLFPSVVGTTPNFNECAPTDITGQSDTSAIAGLWDSTDASIDDVAFIEISTNGRLNIFDYLGDGDFGGANCYQRFGGEVQDLGGDTYEIFFDDIPAIYEGSLQLLYVTAYVVDDTLLWQNASSTSPSYFPAVTGARPVFNECVGN